MDHELAGFVLSIIAIVMGAGIIRTFIRAKYGLAMGGGRRRRGLRGAPVEEERAVQLLTSENDALKGQVTRLEERIAVLERIATDKSRRLADEIDALN